MQSLYKVIKNTNVIENGNKEIVTKFENSMKGSSNTLENYIESEELSSEAMFDIVCREKDSILAKAHETAKLIEQQAYDEGYKKGYEDGYASGHNEAYSIGVDESRVLKESTYRECEQLLLDAKVKAQEIVFEADNTLKSAREEYHNYIKEKKEEIKKLIEYIVENTLNRETKEADSLNEVVEDILSRAKEAKSIVIKCADIYCDNIKSKIDNWKQQFTIRGDIFVIEDNSIELGKVIIEKDNGKIVFGIDIAMEKLREIMESEDIML